MGLAAAEVVMEEGVMIADTIGVLLAVDTVAATEADREATRLTKRCLPGGMDFVLLVRFSRIPNQENFDRTPLLTGVLASINVMEDLRVSCPHWRLSAASVSKIAVHAVK